MTTDASITTWSGRTQEDKNKDIISVKDFGAVGDGVTNDTAAFISLEATFTRRPIDLLGKTYKVNQDFTGHDYYNGILTTGYWEQFEKGTPSSGQTAYFNDVGGGAEYLELDMLPVYVPTDGQGTSTIQGTVFCFKNNVFYTSRVAKKEESVEYMVIEKWGVGDGLKTTPILTSERTLDIGHQSLGLSYANWYDSEAPVNQKWLWSCAGDSKAPYKARYVSKTDFNETTLSLTTYHYQVMAAGEQINENANRALAISVDGTLLCYTYTSLQNIQRCRVFRVSIFKNALVDYSKQYLYDFPLARESYSPVGTPEVKPIQDIACDGNCIYILQGSTNYNYPTDIKVYKLNGEPVTTDHKCWLGRSSAGNLMSQGGTYYIEPESLFFMPCAGRGISLKALVTIGRSINLEGTTQANGLPYPVPAPHHNVIVDSMPAPSVVLRNSGNLVLTGGQRISHPKAAAFKVGYALPDSTVTDYFKTYYGSTSVYGEILTSELSNQAQLRLTKPNHSIMLQVSGYDNAGIFDTTHNFWVIQSSFNGETHLGNSATGKVYVDADYFMPKKYIGSASERADTMAE